MGTRVETDGISAARRLRAILGGAAGNLVEWFDWYAYAAFTLYFAPVFFPEGDQTAQLLQAAAIFAVGFAARPVGAWLVGIYADRAGRRAALSLSVGMMCAGSLMIALIPGHATIGPAAGWLLMVARLVQGLSVGGEYGAAASYMSEMAGERRRGFWSSFHFVTLVGGQLLALGLLILLQHTLSAEALASWGWRVPFVIGALLAVAVFWIRRGLDESASFTTADRKGVRAGTAMTLLRHHPRAVATIVGLTAGGSLSFYIYTSYMQKFLVNTAGYSKTTASEISAAALVAFMLFQPVAGWLSDKVGRRAMLIGSFGGGALILWPVMAGVARGAAPLVALTLILGALALQAGYTAIGAVLKAELFPTHVRALGVALPYAVANAAFGGTAEYVALWFKSEGIERGFYVYAVTLMTVSFVTALLMRDTKRHSRIAED
ncbi:MFS transporter [Sphingomonas solaris]|uniref:MFS transporter n=1 Tax=Alterirhizorhabdus solaris TaxID=2529389 RepID=A0A558QWH5_9SPHN|nr:MFS transporter [Sphingomonas solaris]TVV71475.1 MFS transporter [Sphingomonas solaris]